MILPLYNIIYHMGWCNISNSSKSPEINDLQLAETQELDSKSSHLWDCIGRIREISGGFIYQFKLKPQFLTGDKVNRPLVLQVNETIFPATEPDPADFEHLTRQKDLIWDSDPSSLGRRLGYYWDSAKQILELPDRKTLTKRWEKIPELPPLNIASGEGIADDDTFIQATLKHDALLTTGVEYVHDHYYHVANAIRTKMKPASIQAREVWKKDTYALYGRIVKARQRWGEDTRLNVITTLLSAYVDAVAATESSPLLAKNSVETLWFPQVLHAQSFRNYMQDKYPKELLEYTSLIGFWRAYC